MPEKSRLRRTAAPIALGALLLTTASLGAAAAHGAFVADATPTASTGDHGEVPTARLEARRTGKPVELLSQRTETSQTFANPDGSFTTKMTPAPERIKQDGRWKPVDVTLSASGGRVVAKAHPEGLTLATGGGQVPASLKAAAKEAPQDLVTLGTGDDQIRLQWKGGLPAPVLDGTTAVYNDALPGADVIVEATRTGFEQYVRLDKRPQSGAYSYTLPLKTNGLKAVEQGDGSVLFTDAAGKRRAVMPAPVMWDAAVDEQSGEHLNRHSVDMEVVDNGAGSIDLVVTPDAGFLADPDTKYPVTVDPSTSALASTFDTYVQQGETVDLSTDTELDFGNPGTTNSDGTPRTARSFIHWNTQPIQDALISSATLQLYNFHSGNTGCTAQGWTVWATSQAGTGSRWTNQPSWLQQYATSTETKGNPSCTSAPDGWIKADVTDLVQYWASEKVTRGFMGLRAATDSTEAWKRVNSGNNTANQPKLSVTYNFRPGNGHDTQAGPPFEKDAAGVWQVDTDVPFLRATFDDADGDTVNGTFDIRDAATGAKVGDYLVSDWVAAGTPAEVRVPADLLQDGKTYEFRASAYDGTHYDTGWTPWTKFTVNDGAPTPPTVQPTVYPTTTGGPKPTS
ncbi:DNRLRE domain-containing protein [Streptomyces sp. KR55]|uniref:DNRLRE domain-containing protein n=1 Tax=Streptomyces sp. KR55 TaxID=3457425 RepID=UPI003FD2C472